MDTSKLQNLGLSQNESKCYVSLLQYGSSSANEISRKSGVHRVAVYDALRGLREKGLISQIMKSSKFVFEAANPEKLNEIIKEKEEKLNEAKKVIPDLLDYFQRPLEKQEIHSFKGIPGIRTVLNEMLKSKTEILDFGAEYKIKEFLKNDYVHWDKERKNRKIKMRIIANEKIKPVTIPLTQIKYISQETNSDVSTYIFDNNKVAMIMWVENPLAVLIEHEAIYSSYKTYFEYLWKISKE